MCFIIFVFSSFVVAQQVNSVGLIIDPEMASDGLKVLAVTPNSTADKLGVKPGNYIAAVNGVTANSENAKKVALSLFENKDREVISFRLVRDSIEIEMIAVSLTETNHCGVVYAKSIKNNLSAEELYGVKISNINGEARLSNSYRYKLKSGFNYMKLSDLVFSEVDEYNRKPYTANPVNDAKLRKARNNRPRKDVAVYLPAGYSYSFAAKLLRDLSSKQIHSRY